LGNYTLGDNNRRNVFVVGAGASREFGLPTGAELLDHLSAISGMDFERRINGNPHIYNSFIHLLSDYNADREAKADFNDILTILKFINRNCHIAPSIDNFIHTHNENDLLVKISKLLICIAILEAESESTLKIKDSEKYINFSKHRNRTSNGKKNYNKNRRAQAFLAWELVQVDGCGENI